MEYYSAIKENIWASSNEVDKNGAYYTEWSKSERERQILYMNTYIWNLERQYWRSYMQGSKGDTDVKNRLLDSAGEGEGGMIWEKHWNMYITIYKIHDQCKFDVWSRAPKVGALGQPRGIGWGGRWVGGSGLGGTHVYLWLIHVDVWQKPSLHCKVIIL